MSIRKFSVILPALNERANLNKIVESIHHYQEIIEILIIDDLSSDGTEKDWPNTQWPKVKYCPNSFRLGLATSIWKGILWAEGNWLLVRDSDLNHDLRDTQALLDTSADFCLASRYKKSIPGLGRLNDFFSTLLSILLRRPEVSDWTYGYYSARKDLLTSLPMDWIFHGRGDYMVRLFRSLLRQGSQWQFSEIATKLQPRGSGKSTTSLRREAFNYLRACTAPIPNPEAFRINSVNTNQNELFFQPIQTPQELAEDPCYLLKQAPGLNQKNIEDFFQEIAKRSPCDANLWIIIENTDALVPKRRYSYFSCAQLTCLAERSGWRLLNALGKNWRFAGFQPTSLHDLRLWQTTQALHFTLKK